MSARAFPLPKTRSRPDIVVVGGVNTDCVMKTDDFPQPGKAALADHFQCLPGGKGLNQAVAAARLGARVALIAMLGDDRHAEEICERLEAEGVDTRYVFRTSNARTGATTILVNREGKSLRAAYPGANRLLLPQDITSASELIRKTGMVLAQLEVPVPTVRQAFELGRQAGATTMLDAGPPTAMDPDFLRSAVILRADADEAGTASGMAVSTPQSALEAGRALLGRGPEMVAIGTGDGGNAILASDAVHRYAPDGKPPVDKAGAGDAFSAAFAVAVLEGLDLETAGAMAHSASGYSIGVLGALPSLPSRRELEAHLACRTAPAHADGHPR
jgi:ribokinase